MMHEGPASRSRRRALKSMGVVVLPVLVVLQFLPVMLLIFRSHRNGMKRKSMKDESP